MIFSRLRVLFWRWHTCELLAVSNYLINLAVQQLQWLSAIKYAAHTALFPGAFQDLISRLHMLSKYRFMVSLIQPHVVFYRRRHWEQDVRKDVGSWITVSGWLVCSEIFLFLIPQHNAIVAKSLQVYGAFCWYRISISRWSWRFDWLDWKQDVMTEKAPEISDIFRTHNVEVKLAG